MSSPFGDRINHFAVILAGGSGTRLWPLSRPERPKHLIDLGGGSLLQQTARRIAAQISTSRIVTVVGRSHAEATAEQLSAVDPRLKNGLLLEPCGRNTLPAIAWAVLRTFRQHPDALVSVFPSDHRINDLGAFADTWKTAAETAQAGFLVTFGLTPEAPETGYGYIKAGAVLRPGAHTVDSFVEKPDAETAREYVASGHYYWNSGMFVFPAALFLRELDLHQPAIAKALRVFEAATDTPASEALYEGLPALSIDYGLMEKSQSVAVVPSQFGWSDLGSWDSVHRTSPKDNDGNVAVGNVLSEDSKSSLFFSERGLLAAIGVENLAIVQTSDAVLVAALDKSQDVKKLFEKVVRSGTSIGDIRASVRRPWGAYRVLEEGSAYKIKKIVVDPGQKLSLQRHRQRAEHWVVVEGTAKVTCGEKEIEMKANESTFIPQGEKHRLENPGSAPLVIIEVQTGSYVGEDDIERFEDIYGRPTKA